MKKKIGISFTTTNLAYYWSWFTPQDLQQVVLVDLSFEKKNEADFSSCDGFILTGGVDIHPGFYKNKTDYANSPIHFQPERDYFEEKMFRYSQENQKPVLGICRGLQLVNVLQGGGLIQDLGEADNRMHVSENGIDKEHPVAIIENTLLNEISGARTGIVNSAHHQVADPQSIGDNLMVNAYCCPEKFIEGLEFKDKAGKAFMLCVQWHPERIRDSENLLTKRIKSSFLHAVCAGY